MHCGVFNVPQGLCFAEVGLAGVDDHSGVERLNGRNTLGRSKSDRNRLPGQTVLGGRAISEWVCLETPAGESNRLPVKKNREFSEFVTPALPFRRGGRGDEWHYLA